MKFRLSITNFYSLVILCSEDVFAFDVGSLDPNDVSHVSRPKTSRRTPVPFRTAPGLRPPELSSWNTDFIVSAVLSNLNPVYPLETHAQPHLQTLVPRLLRRLPWLSLGSETPHVEEFRNHLVLQSQLLHPGDEDDCAWGTGPVLLVTDAGRRLVQEFLQTPQPRGWRLVASQGKVAALFSRRCRGPFPWRRELPGGRVVLAVGVAPPFAFTRDHPNGGVEWDGLEVRLVRLIAETLDLGLEFKEIHALGDNSVSEESLKAVVSRSAHIAAAGIYATPERLSMAAISAPHSVDCATFLTLATTALPRYRAIMGPFHWTVWLALTLTYLVAIFPLAFSHRHTLSHLLTNPWEMENMFWYVFGTFTNCFSFVGKGSWSKANMNATKMLIGWYWVFSIIITACYTGSIIAFVTIPVFPSFVNSGRDVLARKYGVGTLGHGGWEHWFRSSADPVVEKLFGKIQYLPDVYSGLKNVSDGYYRPYAFLSSRAQLQYIISSNSSTRPKRSAFHLADECFVPFSVSLAMPSKTPFAAVVSQLVLRASQSGLVLKIRRDIEWEGRKNNTGQLLQGAVVSSIMRVKPEERKLSLDDVQGTFLLLGAGFAIGIFALLLEFLSWLSKKCLHKCSSYAADVVHDNQEQDGLFLIVPGPHWKSYSLNDLAVQLQRTAIDEPETRTMPDMDVRFIHSPYKAGISKTDQNLLSVISALNVCTSVNNLRKQSLKESNEVNVHSNRRVSI